MLKSLLLIGFLWLSICPPADAAPPDPKRDILVTFDNTGASPTGAGLGSPYSNRKRYSITRSVRRNAAGVAAKYSLTEVEHWPIRALSIYCFVFRVPEDTDRAAVIEAIAADDRVESVQPLQSFETRLSVAKSYDDTYVNLQYGLEVLNIAAAHRTTTGNGIRIAIIDSHADEDHEDLKGRIDKTRSFSGKGAPIDDLHGTAVASVIGARSNNARGIVGVAPQATLELYVSCWSGGHGRPAVCDSFSLSKALDAMLDDPPHILNLSLNGPRDPLLERLLMKTVDAGVVIVAAGSSRHEEEGGFPSNMEDVIGVGSSADIDIEENVAASRLFAPGDRILVAVPTDQYDFRSGSSLAAAHVSGVVALLMSVSTDLSTDAIRSILVRSQSSGENGGVSINACQAINLAMGEALCAP